MKKVAVRVEAVFAWLGRHTWVPILLARLAMAGEFIPSGAGKLGNLPKLAAYFAQLRIPAPSLNAAATATTSCTARAVA
jgi:uncharacterized membrane protein YphA (DoxX/SURF4 family)